MKRDMTSGNVTISLLYFIVPLTLGNILQQLYNLVDTYIVGRYVGSQALSAVGSVSNLIFMFNAVVLGLKAGISVICSESYGKRDERDFNTSRTVGFVLISTAGAICTLIGLFEARNIMGFIKVPDLIFQDAYGYFRIILLGYPFVFLFNYGIAITQARGNSNITFISLLSSTICNIVLDLVLICKLGLGVNGAAVATVISQALSMIIVFTNLVVTVPRNKNKIEIESGIEKLKDILKVSFPSILQQGILSLGIVLITALINQCGTAMIAGVAIGGKIDGIISLPILTIAEALAVFTAQNIGAGKPERVEIGLKAAMKLCGMMVFFLSVLIYYLGPEMIALFLDSYDKAIVSEGMNYMVSILVMMIFMIFFRCFIGVYTGLKEMRFVLLAFSLNIISRVSFAYATFPILGKWSVYIANPLSVLVGAVAIMSVYFVQKANKNMMNTKLNLKEELHVKIYY